MLLISIFFFFLDIYSKTNKSDLIFIKKYIIHDGKPTSWKSDNLKDTLMKLKRPGSCSADKREFLLAPTYFSDFHVSLKV